MTNIANRSFLYRQIHINLWEKEKKQPISIKF